MELEGCKRQITKECEVCRFLANVAMLIHPRVAICCACMQIGVNLFQDGSGPADVYASVYRVSQGIRRTVEIP